jgi:hypothetical protein
LWVAHGSGVVNGVVVVEVSSLALPPSPPSRNSMTGPIGTAKPMMGPLGTSKVMSPMFLLRVEYREGRGGPNGAGEYPPIPALSPTY